VAGKPKVEHVFTEAYIAWLKPKPERYEIHDKGRPGLLVRVSPTGHKSFCVVQRVKGRGMERHTLGAFPKVSVADAQKKAKILTGRGAAGESTVGERRKLKSEMTLGELWTLFLERHAKANKRSWETDARRWKKHLALLAGERLGTFTTPRVAALLADIGARCGTGAANRVRALLFTMFEKGRREWGLGTANPVQDTPRNPEHGKDRYLLPEELRRFIKALEADPDANTRDWLHLALFTGQRGGTLCRAKWANLNLKDGAWSIPAEDMKAGKPLLVPLAPAVVELLRERRALAAKGAVYVFPSSRPEGLIATPRDGFKRVLKAADVTGLTPHDLRRSFATWAQDAGTPSIVLARLLGHSPVPGMAVTGLYAQTPLDVLRRWSERTVENMLKVARAPEDGKVLRFPGAVGGAV
jgi:integrase